MDLIRVLQEDGRRPIAEIARVLDVPMKTVTNRVNSLRASAVIEIAAVSGPAALGYNFSGLLGLRLTPHGSRRDVLEELWKLPNTHCVSVVGGDYDIIVEFVCRDSSQFVEIIEETVSPISAIREVDAFPYLSIYFQRFRYPVSGDASEAERDGALLDTHQFDEMDHRIISTLSPDGRMPFQTIAEQLGVSESQVRRRIARMIESGGLRIMALANPVSLGFTVSAWLSIQVSGSHKVRAVADELCKIPAVSYLTLPTGKYDIFVDVVARDRENLLDLLDNRVRSIKGISRVDVWQALEPLHWRPLRPAIDESAAESAQQNGRVMSG